MIISPRWGIYMSLFAAVIGVLLLCGTEFTTLFGQGSTLKILAALAIFNAVINAANGVLHMIPSGSTPQALNQFPLGPARVIIFLAVLLGSLAFVPARSLAASLPPLPTLAQLLANPALLFSAFTPAFVTDVGNALADAKGQTPPDQDSITCYTYLLALAQSPIVNPLPTTPGVLTAIQKGRDANNNVASLTAAGGPLAGLNSACAAWLSDNKIAIAQLAARLGAVAGAAGLKLSLGGLAL